MSLFKKLQKSKIARDSIGYTILNFLEKALPFLILPIITRKLPIEEVGYYMLYQSLIEILLPVITLNVDQSILLNYYKLGKEDFNIYFSNGIVIFISFYTLCILLTIQFEKNIATIIGFPLFWLNIVVLIILFRFFTQIRLNFLRIQYKIKQYGVYTCGISVVNNCVGLFLIFYSNLGWTGLLIGHLVGYFIFATFSLISFYREKIFKFVFKVSDIQDIFKIGIPMTLHRMGIWMGTAMNRIIITSILGAAATGSYGVGATFATIVTILEDAFSKAFTPHIYDKLKLLDEKKKNEVVSISYGIYLFLILVSLLTSFAGYYGVGLLFGKSYESTRIFIFPLILAAMFKGFYKLHVNYIFFSKQTFEITKITLSTGILNIFFAYFMIHKYGLLGAAYSLLAVNIIQYVLSFHVGNKLIPMPWMKNFKNAYAVTKSMLIK